MTDVHKTTSQSETSQSEERTAVRATARANPSEGPAAAALIAAGVGTFVLGLLTTLAAASEPVKEWLAFNDPVGPLSGKVILSVATWIVAWIVLHVVLRERGRLDRRVLTAAGALVVLGLLGTFPLFFEAFEG